MLVQVRGPLFPRYADPPPVLRHWQPVLSTTGINEYSSRKLLVKVLTKTDLICNSLPHWFLQWFFGAM